MLALVVSATVVPQRIIRAQPAAPALKIVVIEGEGAVNIIQQKTAVAPVIEVRDRNDQPVAGAVVQFVVRNGRATFSGARALSVTTNAAGRAVAAGFTPTGSGAVQIGATAAFQGQSAAAVTIAQTNVMTAAQAAAAASSAGTTGTGTASGGGAGAGGGGGIGLTTVAVAGAVVAGGVVAAQKLIEGKTYTGQFSGVLRDTNSSADGGFSCIQDERQTGEIRAVNVEESDGRITGNMNIDGNIQLSPGTCPPNSYNTGTDSFGLEDGRLTGTTQSVTMSANASNDFSDAQGSGVNSYDYTFTGTFDGTQFSGILTVVRTVTFVSRADGSRSNSLGTVSYDVVLR